jgi:hypothetical protein
MKDLGVDAQVDDETSTTATSVDNNGYESISMPLQNIRCQVSSTRHSIQSTSSFQTPSSTRYQIPVRDKSDDHDNVA